MFFISRSFIVMAIASLVGFSVNAAEVKGFRKAIFGATEQSVLVAISQDLNIAETSVQKSIDPGTGMRVFEVSIPEFEPLNVPAKIHYVFGYKCHCLVQVGIRWMIPDTLNADKRVEVLASVGALQTHVTEMQWPGDQAISNRTLGSAKVGENIKFLFFRGVNERNSAIEMFGDPVNVVGDPNDPKAMAANFDHLKIVELLYNFDTSKQDVRRVNVNGF